MVVQDASMKHGQALKAAEAKMMHAEEARKLAIQANKAAEVGSCLFNVICNMTSLKRAARHVTCKYQVRK